MHTHTVHYTYTHIHTHICTHIYSTLYIHTYAHTYSTLYIHTYTCTRIQYTFTITISTHVAKHSNGFGANN